MADYLSDEEQLERLKNWWAENGRWVVTAMVLALGGFVGWRWYDAARAEAMQVASDAYEAYQAATGDARGELAENLAAEYSDTSYATFSLWYRAKEAVDAGDLDAAVEILRQVAETDTHPLLRDIARLRLARLLREQGDAEAALSVLAAVTSPGFRASALELKGDIHLLQGERELAHEAYLTASESIKEGDQRPVLDMKVADTAPAEEDL